MGKSEERNGKKRRRSRSRSPERRSDSRDERRDDRRDKWRRERDHSRSPARTSRKDQGGSQRGGRERSRDRDEQRSSRDHRQSAPSSSSSKKEDEAEIAEKKKVDEEMKRRRERLKLWQEQKAKEKGPSSGEILTKKAAQKTESELKMEEYFNKVNMKKEQEEKEGSANSEQQNEQQVEEEMEERDDGQKGWTLEDDDEEEAVVASEQDPTENKENEPDLPPPIQYVPSSFADDEEESQGEFLRAAALKLKNKARGSRWENTSSFQASNTKNTPASSTQQTNNQSQSLEEDPLDAFMTSLYGSGDVATQKELEALKTKESTQSKQLEETKPFASTASIDNNNNGDNDSDEDINYFGNNSITMDEIMASMSSSRGPSNDRVRRGWESDAGGDDDDEQEIKTIDETMVTIEGDETEEARQERERQEFIEAIRKAREEEELMREKLKKIDEEVALEKLERKKRLDELGRIFQGEGDVADEREIEKKRSALEILEEAKKGKVLKEVDHNKITYLNFRKNLYIVPKVLAKLSEEDIQEKRENLQIKVRGKGCPVPVDSWEQCGLADKILQSIYANNMKEPFPIQKQAIPAIMCGRDVIGVAKTGSGKTLAFLLPMLRHIQDQPPLQDSEGPIGLIMAPARELANQIYQEAKKFTKALGMRVACGAGVAEQIADLKRGSEIVVCTPGRMIDILCMQAGKLVSLKRVTMVVLDEADRMFDMGFEPQIKMIMQNIRPDRQTVLFSATFPKQIEKLAKSVLRLPLEIIVGERSTVNKDITQYVEVHEEEDKFLRLLQLLGVWYEKGSILIFVDKQEKCDQLFQELLKLGYPCLSLHGGKDQVDRDHTLHEFKTGIKTVMIATSVAGRGLDVPDIVCVINYNCPNHLEDYVHRVGRTGRAGRKGSAYTFLSSKEEQYAPIMLKALQKAGRPIPEELQKLAEGFKSKVDRGEAHWSGSGFVGKGFTFDASEMNEAQKIALMQKKAYDAEQGLLPESATRDDDADDEFEEEYEATSASASTITSTAVSSSSASAASSIASAPQGALDPRAALARARLIAMQLASGKRSTEGKEDYFSEELDINDYPPQARKKVTNRNVLDDVTEQTGVAIIARGFYIPPGKKHELGDRRLHLLIEGNNELSVRQAKMEIQRLLEEETLKISGAVSTSASGRYSVL